MIDLPEPSGAFAPVPRTDGQIASWPGHGTRSFGRSLGGANQTAAQLDELLGQDVPHIFAKPKIAFDHGNEVGGVAEPTVRDVVSIRRGEITHKIVRVAGYPKLPAG